VIGLSVAGIGLVVGLSMAGSAFAGAGGGSTGLAICGALPVGTLLPDGSHLSSGQVANASIIVGVASEIGAGIAGAVDAVTAAFTESRLTNVAFGDRDSLGLFQERPSQGWGSPAQVMDPVYATQQFLDRLTVLPGWQSLAPAVAAQDVERSAYPDRYQLWVQSATELVAGLSGAGECTDGSAGGQAGRAKLPAGFTLPPGTSGPVVTAIGFALAQLGKPYVWGGIGPSSYDCSGLVMAAYQAAGISLPRTTYQQVYAGQPVYDPASLEPGDLIFIEGSDPGPGGAPGHVGMYIAKGWVIDAPYTGRDVQLTPLSSWISQIVAMRRVVGT
jgi:cell wall-associated NlpC family hydrolase